MQSDSLIRFYKSINLDNIDDYDLEFSKVTKLDGVINIEFKKQTPWDYDLLTYFIECLGNITTYKYNIKFIYKSKINEDNILNIFNGIYEKYYHKTCDYKYEFNSNLLIIYNFNLDDKISNLVKEFNELIRFINYPLYTIVFKSEKEIKDLNINENIESDFISNEISFNEELEDEQEIYKDEDFYPDEYKKNEIDFEHVYDDLIVEESKAFVDELHYMDEKLEGLDTSRNYIEYRLNDLNRENMRFYIEGYIFSLESDEVNKGKNKQFSIGLYMPDDQYATVKAIDDNKYLKLDYLESFKKDDLVALTGFSYKSKRTGILTFKVTSIKKIGEKPLRDDNEEVKRVELHLHTQMSAMDAVTSIDDYCKLASHMGHKAIALTDHGVVQAFPKAQKAAKKYGIKMLYGCEFYVVNDDMKAAYNPNKEKLDEATYVAFDLETTGLSSRYNKIIEFGAVKFKNGIEIGRKDILINPEEELSETISNLTHITNEMLKNAPKINECIDEILEFIEGSVLVSHNLEFDYNFLNEALIKCKGEELKIPGIDTLEISHYLFPNVSGHTLGNMCSRYEVQYDKTSAHRADYDAEVLYKAFISIVHDLINKGFKTVDSIEHLPMEAEHIKHARKKHVCAIAKNKDGLKDIYKLVSLSHIKYLGDVPCVPRSELIKYRSNILLGSACFNGEVFEASFRLPEKKLDEIVSFYDYIEIQPMTNYMYLVNVHQRGYQDVSDIERTLNGIIESANKQNKLICATGDVHYLNPEDKIFRDVYVYSSGVGKTAHPLMPAMRMNQEKRGYYFENPDQYYRSTREMLDEFSSRYGEENAYKWVVTNTNIIADSCEEIIPIIENKLFTPTIENCEEMLKDICYKKAHELYGDTLPEIVEKRLERELGIGEFSKGGIINSGYSVIYYIAYEIIKKTHEDGYIVGSRGSVGSSFVATMANITEVNPLPPHYRCPKCKHFELYEGNEYFSGYDLPEKTCPHCGTKMISDGQNIPFETFLGFEADKVPDIDLNFPPDYQARAHNITKTIFGEHNVFRAGTISTVATKTAFGYARGFFEKRYKVTDFSNINPSKIAFLANGCADVKRTTGQHPGGIIVIPKEYEVYDFTPIQYPADDMEADWFTSHFEFKAIHDTVLKLDLLGHVDPQALKFMCDKLNINYKDIPLTDKNVISLFYSPKVLNLKHNYLNETNGAIALPEFGTSFVRGLLDATKPNTFNDLIIISGLSHGTNVWNGNAEDLIQNGDATLRTVIGCRDDIMTYLMRMGLEGKTPFTIMESVRKGKGLTDEQIKLMKEHGVPDYYIDSCLKIKYLFPKAHATAYVTMAVRVGWFKVYQPLIFYAGFFTVRCDKYEWETMYKGANAIISRLDALEKLKRENKAKFSNTYEEVQKTLTVALEFYDRGFKFLNLDLERSLASEFIIDEEHQALIPPFKVIDSLGDTAAQSIIDARNEGKFKSIEDFINRTKINNTQINIFKSLGIFKDLPEKEVEQLSLFDCF